MNRNLLFHLYRHIVKHRDWLCMKFITRRELTDLPSLHLATLPS